MHACAQLFDVLNYPRKGSFLNKQFLFSITSLLSPNNDMYLRRAEINIKPWKHLLNDLKEGNKRMGWMAREPYAYWKGNPSVALIRQELMKCNVSDNQDWNARVYALVTF